MAFCEFVGGSDHNDDDPLMDAGLDSLSAQSFRTRIIQVFCTSLPGTLVFDYRTIAGIAEYLQTKLGTA
jgi:acyl carrier protein